MIPKMEDESLIRRYLLGDLTEEERRRIEIRVFDDQDFAESFPDQLSVVEDELIEDYVKDVLLTREKKQFEDHFLRTDERREKLAFVRSLSRYATEAGRAREERRASWFSGWLSLLLAPRWKPAVVALVLLSLGAVTWRVFFYRSQVERGLIALNQAYRQQRPVASRITGLNYADFPESRGDGEKVDSRARDRAERLLLDAVDEKATPESLHALGKSYLARKKFDQAIEHFEAALKSDPNNARLYSDLGAALFERGKLERRDNQSGKSEVTIALGLESLNKALSLDDSLLDAIFNRALVYREMKLYQQARNEWTIYLKKDPDSSWAEEAKRNLKLLDEDEKKVSRREDDLFQDFIQAYRVDDDERAWRAFRRSHFRTGNYIADRLVKEFLDLNSKGQNEAADDRLRALGYAGALSERRTRDRFTATLARSYRQASPNDLRMLAQARALTRRAYGHYEESIYGQAIDDYAKARDLFEKAGDIGEAAQADYWIGHCQDLREDASQSIDTLTAVAERCERLGFSWLQTMALGGLTSAYASLSEYSAGIGYSERSLELSKRLEDENGELDSVTLLASLYRAVGRYRESLGLTQQGLQLADALSADNWQRAGFYSTAAWDFSALGMYETAMLYQQETLRLADQRKNPLSLSRYFIHLGLIYRKLNDYENAISAVRRGLEIGEKSADREAGGGMVNYALLNLGHIYRDAGQFDQSIESFNKAIEFGKEKNARWLLYIAYKGRLLTYVKKHDIAAASGEMQRILEMFEEYRGKILEDKNRSSFFDGEQSIYDLAVDFAYTELTSQEKAFEYSELARARSMLDAAKATRPATAGGVTSDPRSADFARPANLDEVQRRMPNQVQILQYASLEDKLIVWLISKERIESHPIHAPLEKLTALVRNYLEWVSHRPGTNEIRTPESAKTLYELLVQPVEASFEDGKLLCIVPDKILNSLPFGALVSRASNKYLIESRPILYASSASMFLASSVEADRRAGAKQERLLSVGNPRFRPNDFPELDDLPSAEDEANGVIAYYSPNRLLRGPEALKETVCGEMEKADVAHLALHHIPDPQSPMNSKLILAAPMGADGSAQRRRSELSAREIYDLDLTRLRLVVLSACRSRDEEYLQREGPVGVARAFLMAGVPLVVASLWRVDSPAAKELMISFHQNRKRKSLSTVEAMRDSQLAMIGHSQSAYRHPYYWASFVTIGGRSEF
jgi:CHAT domain-containing protein/Tfp pilus assembly protein PilF